MTIPRSSAAFKTASKGGAIMAITVTFPTNGGSENQIASQQPDYTEYAVVSDTPSECRITDVVASLETPRIVRYAAQDVANVYSGLDIDPSAYAPIRRGKSVVIQTSLNVKVTDTTDPSFLVLLPVQIHTVVKLPVTSYLSSADINAILRDHFGDIITSNDADRLPRLLRGALKPSELE
jgi:hypothetical protein